MGAGLSFWLVGQDPMGPAQNFAYSSASTTPVIFKKQNPKMKPSTQDKAAGTAKNIAGRVKEVTGRVIGNPRLQADGQTEKVQGQIQKKVGEIEHVLGN